MGLKRDFGEITNSKKNKKKKKLAMGGHGWGSKEIWRTHKP